MNNENLNNLNLIANKLSELIYIQDDSYTNVCVQFEQASTLVNERSKNNHIIKIGFCEIAKANNLKTKKHNVIGVLNKFSIKLSLLSKEYYINNQPTTNDIFVSSSSDIRYIETNMYEVVDDLNIKSLNMFKNDKESFIDDSNEALIDFFNQMYYMKLEEPIELFSIIKNKERTKEIEDFIEQIIIELL